MQNNNTDCGVLRTQCYNAMKSIFQTTYWRTCKCCITYLLLVTDQRCHKARLLFLLHVDRNTVHWPSKHASYTIDFCFSQMERSTGRAKQLDIISFPRWCHMSWIWWFWWDFIPGLSHETWECFCTTGTQQFKTCPLKRSTGRAEQLDTVSFITHPLTDCNLEVISFSSASSLCRRVSHERTLSMAGVSSPTTSCSTWSTVMWEAILRCRLAIIRRSVVLPIPFRPIRPYRRPNDINKSAPLSNVLSETNIWK